MAKIFHGDNTTVELQRLNRIQECEYTNQIFFYPICKLFCYFSNNEKRDLFLIDNFMSGLEVFKNWRINKNIVAYKKNWRINKNIVAYKKKLKNK